MIKAYSRTPRPYGSVLASEIFGTGLLASASQLRLDRAEERER